MHEIYLFCIGLLVQDGQLVEFSYIQLNMTVSLFGLEMCVCPVSEWGEVKKVKLSCCTL